MYLGTVFLTPVSESRSLTYAKYMPSIIWLACHGALIVCPVLIVIVNIVALCTLDKKETFLPAALFTIFAQTVLLISFFTDLKETIDEHFEDVYDMRQAYYDIRDAGEQLNIYSEELTTPDKDKRNEIKE